MKILRILFLTITSAYYIHLFGKGVAHASKSDKFIIILPVYILILAFIVLLWKRGLSKEQTAIKRNVFLLLATVAVAMPFFIVYVAIFTTGDFYNAVVIESILVLVLYACLVCGFIKNSLLEKPGN